MAPDQIDEMIQDEIRTQKSAITRIEREREWAQKKVAELHDHLGCDHEREHLDGMRDKCRRCGFTWVRR